MNCASGSQFKTSGLSPITEETDEEDICIDVESDDDDGDNDSGHVEIIPSTQGSSARGSVKCSVSIYCVRTLSSAEHSEPITNVTLTDSSQAAASANAQNCSQNKSSVAIESVVNSIAMMGSLQGSFHEKKLTKCSQPTSLLQVKCNTSEGLSGGSLQPPTGSGHCHDFDVNLAVTGPATRAQSDIGILLLNESASKLNHENPQVRNKHKISTAIAKVRVSLSQDSAISAAQEQPESDAMKLIQTDRSEPETPHPSIPSAIHDNSTPTGKDSISPVQLPGMSQPFCSPIMDPTYGSPDSVPGLGTMDIESLVMDGDGSNDTEFVTSETDSVVGTHQHELSDESPIKKLPVKLAENKSPVDSSDCEQPPDQLTEELPIRNSKHRLFPGTIKQNFHQEPPPNDDDEQPLPPPVVQAPHKFPKRNTRSKCSPKKNLMPEPDKPRPQTRSSLTVISPLISPPPIIDCPSTPNIGIPPPPNIYILPDYTIQMSSCMTQQYEPVSPPMFKKTPSVDSLTGAVPAMIGPISSPTPPSSAPVHRYEDGNRHSLSPPAIEQSATIPSDVQQNDIDAPCESTPGDIGSSGDIIFPSPQVADRVGVRLPGLVDRLWQRPLDSLPATISSGHSVKSTKIADVPATVVLSDMPSPLYTSPVVQSLIRIGQSDRPSQTALAANQAGDIPSEAVQTQTTLRHRTSTADRAGDYSLSLMEPAIEVPSKRVSRKSVKKSIIDSSSPQPLLSNPPQRGGGQKKRGRWRRLAPKMTPNDDGMMEEWSAETTEERQITSTTWNSSGINAESTRLDRGVDRANETTRVTRSVTRGHLSDPSPTPKRAQVSSDRGQRSSSKRTLKGVDDEVELQSPIVSKSPVPKPSAKRAKLAATPSSLQPPTTTATKRGKFEKRSGRRGVLVTAPPTPRLAARKKPRKSSKQKADGRSRRTLSPILEPRAERFINESRSTTALQLDKRVSFSYRQHATIDQRTTVPQLCEIAKEQMVHVTATNRFRAPKADQLVLAGRIEKITGGMRSKREWANFPELSCLDDSTEQMFVHRKAKIVEKSSTQRQATDELSNWSVNNRSALNLGDKIRNTYSTRSFHSIYDSESRLKKTSGQEGRNVHSEQNVTPRSKSGFTSSSSEEDQQYRENSIEVVGSPVELPTRCSSLPSPSINQRNDTTVDVTRLQESWSNHCTTMNKMSSKLIRHSEKTIMKLVSSKSSGDTNPEMVQKQIARAFQKLAKRQKKLLTWHLKSAKVTEFVSGELRIGTISD